MTGVRLGIIAAAAMLIAAGGLGAAALAQGTGSPQSMQAHFGSMTYRLFCAGCHAPDGRGNEAVSRALGFRSVDLTTIRSRNDGVFASEDVARAILGADGLGHARVKMAPWASMFAEEFKSFASRVAVDQLVDRRIDHLVAYIESIQTD